jgi:hypothetical protein
MQTPSIDAGVACALRKIYHTYQGQQRSILVNPHASTEYEVSGIKQKTKPILPTALPT